MFSLEVISCNLFILRDQLLKIIYSFFLTFLSIFKAFDSPRSKIISSTNRGKASTVKNKTGDSLYIIVSIKKRRYLNRYNSNNIIAGGAITGGKRRIEGKKKRFNKKRFSPLNNRLRYVL